MHIIPSRLVKDPDDALDYRFDFTAWLEGDTIADRQIIVDDDSGTPIAVDNVINTDTDVTVFLSGGTAGTSARVTCRITTAQGRIKDVTPTFDVRER